MSQQPFHLDLRNVSFQSNEGATLVDGVSFGVGRGEIIAVVGPNGAGKTTLIRMLVGLLKPVSGSIQINAMDLPSMSFAERAQHIAYVGQADEPDGRLTVGQYVTLGALPLAREIVTHGAQSHALDAVSKIGLNSFVDVRMDRLSGGERQKAKIARAISQRPSLLVLDEPTNHLDPKARGELLRVVAEIGITVVAALHDLTLIEAFADKVAVLENGQLQAFGPPVDVLSGERVQNIFGVSLHRFQHPDQHRFVPALDIEIQRSVT